MHAPAPPWTLLVAVGCGAFAADLVTFRLAYGGPDTVGSANIRAYLAAACVTLAALLLLDRRLREIRAITVAALAGGAALLLFLRGGILASLGEVFGVGMLAAHVGVAFISSAGLVAGASLAAHQRNELGTEGWNRLCLAAAACAVLMRLVYLGVPELIFEEAYYWNYAQHLDYGYLDHPPMVAWITWLGVAVLGNTEVAVRAGAFLCWMVTAAFSWRLARDVIGRDAGYGALALVAVLPAYFFFGFFMSPDAPLTAAWAAATYFAWRALVRDDESAWLSLGAAFGLGMLSKYTIALLGIAVVAFVVLNARSRKWLSRPQPYAGALIALLLFSPVIAWNWQHDWISFSFQSRGRVEGGFSFSLHRFVGNVLLLMTPTGIASVAALAIVASRTAGGRRVSETARTSARLLAWLAMLPLAVLAAASVVRASKFNWTGPAWLPLLPYLAVLALPADGGQSRLLDACRRAWPPTLFACLLAYGAALHWLGPGLPGVGYPSDVHLIGWRDFGGAVERLAAGFRRERTDMLVVGMDRNRIASGLAFYRTRYREKHAIASGPAPAFDTASEHLFGEAGLMYELWFPAARLQGRPLLLVGKDAAALEAPKVLAHADPAGERVEIAVRKNGKPAGAYSVRLFNNYRSNAPEVQR